MMDDHAFVDANALAGALAEFFGTEMTNFDGCCAACGTENRIGALLVYRAGPGDVVRCPNCKTVVLVVTEQRDGPRVYLSALRWLQPD
jgi:Family of unknown function (DUF6510)